VYVAASIAATARGLRVEGVRYMQLCSGVDRNLSVRVMHVANTIGLALWFYHKAPLPRLYGEEGLGTIQRPQFESEFPVILVSHEAVTCTRDMWLVLLFIFTALLSGTVMTRRAITFASEGKSFGKFSFLLICMKDALVALFETHHMDDDRKAWTSSASWVSVFVFWFVFSMLPWAMVFVALHSFAASTIRRKSKCT